MCTLCTLHACAVGHPCVRGAGRGFGGAGGQPPGSCVTAPRCDSHSRTTWNLRRWLGRVAGQACGRGRPAPGYRKHRVATRDSRGWLAPVFRRKRRCTSFNNVSPRGSLAKLMCDSSKTGSPFSPPTPQLQNGDPRQGRPRRRSRDSVSPGPQQGDCECCRAPSCVASNVKAGSCLGLADPGEPLAKGWPGREHRRPALSPGSGRALCKLHRKQKQKQTKKPCPHLISWSRLAEIPGSRP